MLIKFFISLFLLAFISNLSAAPEPKKVTSKIASHLYVTAKEAYKMKLEDDKVILVDVRDPIEIMFTGYTQLTDIHVPYKIVDHSMFNGNKKSYRFYRNPYFNQDIEARLDALGANEKTKIIFMCRSGSTRSAPTANIAYDLGYKNVYSMVDGFEGGKSKKKGKMKGARVVSGWKNSGLPWGWKLEENVAYTVLN
jgi:rhodanese-related sulfurtransferase